jgi:hypothetical protein
VSAPDGLLTEVWVRSPDGAWGSLQRGVGGALALLPPTAGEIASGYGDVGPELGRLVDGRATWYGVVAEAPGARLAWALAMPLSSPGRAAALLLDAAAPGGRIARDVDGMRVLSGSADRPVAVSAALAGRWLLVASREDDLVRLGPYAYRTMPTLPAPAGSAAIVATVSETALAGPLASRLAALWEEQRAWLLARDEEQRARHGGRPPDFGDPRAIIGAVDAAMRRRMAFLATARGARLEMTPGDDEVHAELFVSAGGDAGEGLVGAMRTGDVAPLAHAPADAVLAILARDDGAAREDDLRDIEAALDGTLGGRVGADDLRAAHTAMEDWGRARGDWWCAALAWGVGETSRGVWLRTPARDAQQAEQAVRELVVLPERRALGDLLAGSLHLGPTGVTASDIPSFGRANVATFAWLQPKGPAGSKRADPNNKEGPAGSKRADPNNKEGPAGSKRADPVAGVAWGVRDGELVLAAGSAAPQLLAAQATPTQRLADDAANARALGALGSDAAFAVIAEPLRLVGDRRGSDSATAPAVVAWGRKPGDVAWLRVQLDDALLRDLLRRLW